MRRTIIAAAVLATSLVGPCGASRAADDAFDPYAQYPRLPPATVAAEHFDYPLPRQMFYREVYGDIGGYGYPDSITSDREFTSSTPVYMLRHGRGPYVAVRRSGGMVTAREAIGGAPDAGGAVVAEAPLHYLVPDFVGTRVVARDGESYRKVTPGRYENAYEHGGGRGGQRSREAARQGAEGRRQTAQANPRPRASSGGGAVRRRQQ